MKNTLSLWFCISFLPVCLMGQYTPTNPIYNLGTQQDFVTGLTKTTDPTTGERSWEVGDGADVYEMELYERPLQTTFYNGSQGSDYFGSLDIVEASLGYDDNFIYGRIELFSRYEEPNDGGELVETGLNKQYRIRIGQYLLSAEDISVDELNTTTDPKDTDWNLKSQDGTNKVFYDSNDDRLLGSPELVEDSPTEPSGNGYDNEIAVDGTLKNSDAGGSVDDPILWSRVDPNNANTVEFAFAYQILGETIDSLIWNSSSPIIFEATEGLTDPGNYWWNREYSLAQAGSPYDPDNYLENIYELDTLLFNPVPEPATVGLLALPVLGTILVIRRRLNAKRAGSGK
ncbi:MAG: PEP-CTERM sorting domain-containing protein [Puniceicoccaceae bacterium]